MEGKENLTILFFSLIVFQKNRASVELSDRFLVQTHTQWLQIGQNGSPLPASFVCLFPVCRGRSSCTTCARFQVLFIIIIIFFFLFFCEQTRTAFIFTPKEQAQKTQHQACSVLPGGGARPVANLKTPAHWLLQQRYRSAHRYERPKGPDPLSRDVWEALLVKGANVGSTNEEGGKSLNQPITMLDKSSSSKSI